MKKLLSVLLTILMVLTITPIGVSAEESTDTVPMRHPTYGITYKNVRATSQWTDTNYVVRSVELSGGGSHTHTVTDTLSTTLSTSSSAQAAEAFNVEIGVSTTSTVTISDSYTYTCPSTYDSCVVTYYPRYQNYSYDQYVAGIYTLSGTASVFVGFTQRVKFN